MIATTRTIKQVGPAAPGWTAWICWIRCDDQPQFDSVPVVGWGLMDVSVCGDPAVPAVEMLIYHPESGVISIHDQHLTHHPVLLPPGEKLTDVLKEKMEEEARELLKAEEARA